MTATVTMTLIDIIILSLGARIGWAIGEFIVVIACRRFYAWMTALELP